MSRTKQVTRSAWFAAAVLALGLAAGAAAVEPCGDFGECKALIEINATDGDIGFHFLMDGDDLNSSRIRDARNKKLFDNYAKGALHNQKFSELFLESAEHLCWEDPEADPDDRIVTLEQFLAKFRPGFVRFSGVHDGGDRSKGMAPFTHELPAAPVNLAFDGSVISWEAGDDLGNCGSFEDLSALVSAGVLPAHPADVDVVAWEVVLEPGGALDALAYTIRVPGDIAPTSITVPADYLASLPDDTPAKIEVGAIGATHNATFAELGGFCLNQVAGCPVEE